MVDKLFRASEVVVMALKEIEKLFHVSEVVMIESSSLALSSAPYAKFRGHALYARVYVCVYAVWWRHLVCSRPNIVD